MRVNIEHGTETKGVFKKETYYTVTVKVDFTEEEAAIIKKAELERAVIMDRSCPPLRHEVEEGHWNLKVYNLMHPKGDTYVLRTTGEAQAYEEELKEALPLVKQAIDKHREVRVESKSFEL